MEKNTLSHLGCCTKGELAEIWDGGQDAVGCRWLNQVPPEPSEMVAYYMTH